LFKCRWIVEIRRNVFKYCFIDFTGIPSLCTRKYTIVDLSIEKMKKVIGSRSEHFTIVKSPQASKFKHGIVTGGAGFQLQTAAWSIDSCSFP